MAAVFTDIRCIDVMTDDPMDAAQVNSGLSIAKPVNSLIEKLVISC
ncbi:MAG: hypothetical protein OEN02_18305 [Gammaproteobacteria bacterium]|nr:hypothetical protein [Gammaproteobacteria bacterium]MDH3537364.1 hypothetical protein [Gammaproteobacteria bacterium]